MRRSIVRHLLVLTALAAACTDELPTTPTAEPRRLDFSADFAAMADPLSFCNPATITISAGAAAPAPPFPSSIVVSGIGSGRFKVTVTLKRFTHTALADVDMLLVGPGGQTVMLMSDAGGSADFQNATVTFDDDAGAALPVGITGVVPGGSYRPTNLGTNDGIPSGGPAGPYGSSFGVFAGTDANGTWKLYVWDDTFFEGGAIAQGWCVNITPLNSAPIANAGGPYTGSEGSPITFDGTGSEDPDTEPIATYDWTFGDGATGTGPTPQHTYASGGTYEVTLVVTDEHGATSAIAKTTSTVSDVAPTATFSVPPEIDEGGTATISLTSPSAEGVRYAFDCGGGFGAIGGGSSASCAATDDGQLAVRGRVFDAASDDLFSEYSGTIAVKNVAPTATFTNGGSDGEGSPIQLKLISPVDVPADLTGLTYAFDCGAGTYDAPIAASSASCPTTDNGDLLVRGKVIDDDGGETEYTATVTVTNVAPVVSSLRLPTGPFAVGASIPLNAVFSDAGTGDTHTARFELAAGGSVPGIVVETNGSGSVSATVSFPQAGEYTITVSVTDKDGASGSRSSAAEVPNSIVVYNPTAGSVAGGGTFDSPAGGLAAMPALAGRATFAVGAKYIHDGRTLAAHLEFIIKTANFHFRSTSDDLLIIAGLQARYRGEGRVNGAGLYGFEVTAIDGGLIGAGRGRLSANDQIRIRIWNKATGVIVYDNQPQAPEASDAASPLSAGAIVILNR